MTRIIGFCQRCQKNRYFECSKLEQASDEDTEEASFSVCSSCGFRYLEVPPAEPPAYFQKGKKKKKFKA